MTPHFLSPGASPATHALLVQRESGKGSPNKGFGVQICKHVDQHSQDACYQTRVLLDIHTEQDILEPIIAE